jgi:hypothetical protein
MKGNSGRHFVPTALRIVCLSTALGSCFSGEAGPPGVEPAGNAAPGTAGAGGAPTPRPPSSVDPGAQGGAGAGSGGASGGTGGGAGSGGSETPDASSGVDPEPADAGGASDAAPGPTAPGQGPTAEGQIVYAQDFENGHAGITFSPTNLPASRGMIVDDPLGQRGKVMRMQFQPGDNYRIGQYRPRANISNTGFYYSSGDRVSYAWGYMTDSAYIGATIAQNISGGDPIWMLRGRGNGELDVIPGGNGLLPFRLEARKWHDIRVEVYYVGGANGTIDIFIDGTKVFSRKGGLIIGPRAHWDGGIYLTSFGEQGNGPRTARTVYISNLSVGKK